MTLRIKYIVFVSILHLVLIVLIYELLKDKVYLFIASEFALFISMYISYRLYLGLIKPVDFISTSISAIKEEDFSIKFRRTGAGELDKLIDVYNEMIDKIREERTRLQEQHYFLQRIIEASPAGIIILDFNECIHLINPAAEKLLDPRFIDHLIPIELQDHPVLQSLSGMYAGEARTIQVYGMRKFKCQCTTFVDRGFERKIFLLEEVTGDLLAAEKQAYGKVIRMMAHEVNNSIGPINSILQSILSFSDPYSPEEIDDIKEYIKVALDRNLKLNHFTRNFADIIRLPVADLKSGDLQAPIKNALKLMTPEAEKLSIHIDPYLPSEPIRVLMDQEQIEQVLINIIKNSIESIGQAGNIRICAFDHPPRITILDNGAGLSEAQSQQLFTPFYSTKVNGQGIGLTLTREILHHHGADFSLKTLDNGWTEFEINFRNQVAGS